MAAPEASASSRASGSIRKGKNMFVVRFVGCFGPVWLMVFYHCKMGFLGVLFFSRAKVSRSYTAIQIPLRHSIDTDPRAFDGLVNKGQRNSAETQTCVENHFWTNATSTACAV